MKKLDLMLAGIVVIVYLCSMLLWYREVFTYEFEGNMIARYLRSQDIPHEVANRVHISDSDIYVAAGYLYANGENPTGYNFQHPPLVKYLFGYSVRVFNSPYIVQLSMGVLLLIVTYIMGIKLTAKRIVAFIAATLLAIDPVMLAVSSEALLDMGNSLFSLLYVYSFLFLPVSFLLQGLFLGLFAASKFWSTTLFFVGTLVGGKLMIEKKVKWKTFFLSSLTAAAVFSLTYIQNFISSDFGFNLPFHQLKMLNFMLHHNTSSIIGGSLLLFLTGFYYEWWNNNQFVRTTTWTILWPIGIFTALREIIRSKLKKINDVVLFLLPGAYLLFLGSQVPFPRYFLIILPYFYIGLAWTLYKIWKNMNLLFPRK